MSARFSTAVALAATLSLILAADLAWADPVRCHGTIAKKITKYQSALSKNVVGCHKGRLSGKVAEATDCNDAIGADIKLKRGTARQKVIDSIGKACVIDAVPEATVLARYPRCPAPVASSDDGGATAGIDDFDELAGCLLDLSEASIETMATAAVGDPVLPATDAVADCQGAVGKAFAKAVKLVGVVYTKCQSGQEKIDADLDYDSSCLDSAGDPLVKASNAVVGVSAAITKSCSDLTASEWVSLGACAQDHLGLIECAVDRVIDPGSRGLVAAALELPGTCAGSADFVVNAADGHKQTNTQLDEGWTGHGHRSDVDDRVRGGFKLQNCDSDCNDCDVSLDPFHGYCRCDNDPTIECDTIEAADADDCGGNTCHCGFGPPLAVNADGFPLCIVNRFAKDVSGTYDSTGEYAVAMRMRSLVHVGIQQSRPCPVCDGGLCDGGARDGLSCTVDAVNPDFGNTSFDCPPDPLANVTGNGFDLGFELTTGSTGLTAAIGAPYCAAGTCHCSVCSGDQQAGCATDADCDSASVDRGFGPGGLGTCGVNLGSYNPAENDCDIAPGFCTDDGSGLGFCDAGPADAFCSGALRKNGRGILPCLIQADCDSYAAECPGGDCGTCSAGTIRSCFLPTVSATGRPGVFNNEGVAVSCAGATGSGLMNSYVGFPSPRRLRLDLDFDFWCDASHTARFHFPTGSNCNP